MALAIVCFVAFLHGVAIPINIASIGKPRKPVTHGVAIIATLTSFLVIAGLAYVASQL